MAVVAVAGVLSLPAHAASPLVAAAESSFDLELGGMHAQYHENVTPGDDESGLIPGFGVGVSLLAPLHPGISTSILGGDDLYVALNYEFDAGNIRYAGHYQAIDGGGALDAVDRAAFNRAEARVGLGFPLAGGGESIPFVVAGYQAWNRDVVAANTADGKAFYESGLFGLGWRLDQPLGRMLVASATGQVFALAGGGVSDGSQGFSHGFGVTPEERVDLGLDDALGGKLHVFAQLYWQHFNYAGTPPAYYPGYFLYEPFSTTTQIGADIGLGYSFN
ncbi:MAG: hypothetical protein POH28_08080 [Acidocella sp.]|nr:hypothetical protein [Acidocella sp.]